MDILIFAAIIVIILGFWAFLIEPELVEIKKFKMKDENLKGLKIVAASDFHFNPWQEKRVEKVVQIINRQNPDIMLSMGDFVSGRTEKSTLPIEKIAKGLAKIKTKYGFYTVLGNHDNWVNKDEITEELKKQGIKVLLNSNVKVENFDKELYIAGVEDLKTANPNIDKALENVNSSVILLTHSPDIFPDVSKNVNLTLAGHVHGGQVRCPIIGSIFIPSKYGDKYAKGLVEEDGKKIIISKGLGNSLLPVRFNCLPDILVIEFV